MSDERDDRGELVPIGGLWTNADRGGKTYLSGYLGDARLLVFKNKFKKTGEKQPDYRMYVTRKAKPDQTNAPADSEPGRPAAGDTQVQVGTDTDRGTEEYPF